MKRILVLFFVTLINFGIGNSKRAYAASSNPETQDKKYDIVLPKPIVPENIYIDWNGLMKSETIQSIRDNPGKKLEEHVFDPKSELIKRISFKHDGILTYLQNLDDNKNYGYYQPAPTELKDIEKSLNALPLKIRSLLQERLIKIYFVKDFLGSGYADLLLDKDGKMYFFLVFNPTVLKKTLSQWAAHKEETCFIKQKGYELKIKADNSLSGLLGILLHESAHIYDYVYNKTPYVERTVIPLQEDKQKEHPFTRNYWEEYSLPSKTAKLAWHSRISFYGGNGGPHIPIDKAPKLYEQLSLSPFASLYSIINWAEDFAEFFMLYHLVEVLKSPYRIEILKDGKLLYDYEPLKSPLQKKRLAWMKDLYK